MMGRYSLDKPGLVYADSRNEGFDPSQYQTFPADADGIIPITELAWFPDDAIERFVEFIAKAWPREHLEENLRFIADSLGSNRDEHPRDTIRRYLATGFYKDHLSTYKKRPIYWLFSSGKQRAFQCLVYLHRYNEGTLARMRTEYAIPLQGKIAHRIEQLWTEDDSMNAFIDIVAAVRHIMFYSLCCGMPLRGAIYRLLLVAQCNALHEAMPFLFEKIADETELLLPDSAFRAGCDTSAWPMPSLPLAPATQMAPRWQRIAPAVPRLVALILPSDFCLVGQQTPESSAEVEPSRVRMPGAVAHFDVIHFPGERPGGKHPRLARQQLTVGICRPPIYHQMLRSCHTASTSQPISSQGRWQAHYS